MTKVKENNMFDIWKINWNAEAKTVLLNAEDMIEKLETLKKTRKCIEKDKKYPLYKRETFDTNTYQVIVHGDYVNVYLYEKDGYKIYTNNMKDQTKNTENYQTAVKLRPDLLFDDKFKELNGISLRKAFGFVDAVFKACIPKQFYYLNERYVSSERKIKRVKASSIDASSQYPSGCLGILPDAHTGVKVDHYVEPTEEYPFAFYSDGHCAEYGRFNTRTWLFSPFGANLFRFDQTHKYCLLDLPDDKIETVLMKPSKYTMDSTWEYFYNRKKNCEKGTPEYDEAKGVMNKTIGMWHRKDRDEKANGYDYNNHGSFRLAHIVAIAIARGNQKILDKIENDIGADYVLHVCVDGIIYKGGYKQGIDETKFGQFAQEFIDCDFVMTDYNNYIATKNGKCVKFKHGSYDLLDGEVIDELKDFTEEDLFKLSRKDRVAFHI
jgi:hypothetical protein